MEASKAEWSWEILQTVMRLAKGAFSREPRAAARAAIGSAVGWAVGWAVATATGVVACAIGAAPAPTPQAAPAAPATAKPPKPQNVLLVVIDTLRRDHLGCYGERRPLTPRLDAFAADALIFDHCMAASSWTEPSTASLLTGLYPTRHGCHEYARLPEELVLLAERFREHGYRTLGVSGNPNASPQFGFDQGFDTFVFDESDHARDYPDVTELVAQAEALLAQPTAQPTFLYLHVMNVHGPYLTPPAWRDRFRVAGASDFPFQNDLWKDVMRKGKVARRADVTAADRADLGARYAAAVAYTDDVIGAFLERRRAGAAGDEELVVVTADHGEELFDHGGFGHGFTLHHEVVDVPLLVRPAGGGGGRRLEAPVSLVDLPATLLDLLDLLPVAEAGRIGDGQSLRPLLDGGEFLRDAPLVAHLERGKQGAAFLVQSWPLRLIETSLDYAGRRDVVELFDVVADPFERSDLLARDPVRAAALTAASRARRAQLAAQGLAVESTPMSAQQRAQMEALGYGAGGGDHP